MQSVTLTIALLGSVLVLFLRPAYALAAYIGVLVWYPDYLRLTIGTIDISVGRIVVTILLLRCLCDRRICGKFIWSALDTWVTLTVGLIAGLYCVATGFSMAAIENRGGLIIDTWFAYLAARLIITDKNELIRCLKTTSLILAPLAIHGLIEATTGWQPFYQLVRFRPWRPTGAGMAGELSTQARWGLTRAIGPFAHPILFGICFAMFLPLFWALRRQRSPWRRLAYGLSGLAALGALSAMSSGAWSSLLVVVFCLVLEKYKQWTKLVLVSLVGFCILAEIGSNNPLHYVLLSRLSFGRGDWWSRARLIDAAIDNFDEWCLVGYGGKDPGWGSREGGYFWGDFTDANNEFILVGMEGGVLAVVALGGVLVVAFRGLSRAAKQTKDPQLKSIYWSYGSSLVAVIAAWQGVSFFGQMNALFYTLLGTLGTTIAFARSANTRQGNDVSLRSDSYACGRCSPI